MNDIPTIKVLYKPGKYEMIINECDFDEKVHEKIGAKAPKAPEGDKAPKAPKAPKADKGDENPKQNPDEELKKLMGE